MYFIYISANQIRLFFFPKKNPGWDELRDYVAMEKHHKLKLLSPAFHGKGDIKNEKEVNLWILY